MMAFLVVVLVATCLIGGVWFTLAARLRARRCRRWAADFDFRQPCHVHILERDGKELS
jgi:hypothetical protein